MDVLKVDGAQSGENRMSDSSSMEGIGSGDASSNNQLQEYYEQVCWEFGYASLCRMSLPAGLEGKTVVDVGCRRGKGVFKLSERVGIEGHVIGVDWVPEHIAEAIDRTDHALAKTGLPSNNMEFHLGYPEDLQAVGISDAVADAVFVNSVLHLMCDPQRALSEMHRVLKPGGLLICEVALADGPRDPAVVEAARSLGNSIQAAPWRTEFEERLVQMGFDIEVAEKPNPIEASMGFKEGHVAPVAPSSEDVSFEAVVLHAVKR